jgi:hypothetical protein
MVAKKQAPHHVDEGDGGGNHTQGEEVVVGDDIADVAGCVDQLFLY